MTSEDPRFRRLRIGDTERYAAVDALGEHFVAGRLGQDEHQQRCAEALQARTAADLVRLFADLPLPHPEVLPGTGSGVSSTPARGRRMYPTTLVAVVAIVAIAAVVRAPFLMVLLVGLAIYLVVSSGRRR